MWIKLKYISGCILILCAFVGCKTTSGTGRSTAEITKNEETYFASVVNNTFKFNTLSAHLKIEFATPDKEISSRAQLKIINDERLQISIQPLLGIEMFKLELTSDSIKLIDRMNKQYVADNYEEIKNDNKIVFNFRNLQALLSNCLFVPGKNEISETNKRLFRMTKENNNAVLKIKDASDITYTFIADADEKILSTAIKNNVEKNELIWNYNNFKNIGTQKFPFSMNVSMLSGEKEKGAVNLTFTDTEINNPLTMDCKIPTGYKRVKLSQIIKSLKKK